MLYFTMKRFLTYITFSSGLSHSTAYSSYSFCGRRFGIVGKLSFRDMYFNLKYILQKLSNETI